MKLKVSEADLCETLDNTLTLFESAAEKKHLTLSGHCNSPHLTLETDTLRLQQIFTNLVSNAIRYTQTGSVTASVRRRNDGKLELRVSDTGIGIAPEDRDRIFELYYRAENRLHDPESTGLGLAIVAQLVDLLQGEIHLTSQVDVGSTFTIVLPPRLDTRTIKTARR